jgi:hypothetical protein
MLVKRETCLQEVTYTETEVLLFLWFDLQLLATAFTQQVFPLLKSGEREMETE